MYIPESFQEDLEREFQGRLRARWSGKKQCVVIEQRVARNVVGSLPRELFKKNDETRQSLAEGYKQVMDVAVSEQMKCPECTTTLSVPNRTTAQITCMGCRVKGRTKKYIVGYYPLDTNLINHLKSIDPLRNLEKDTAAELNAYNEKIAEAQQKQLSEEAEAYTSDNLNRLMQIPSFSYSGNKIKQGTELRGFTDSNS